MKVSELIAAFEEKFAATEAERSQLIAEGRKKDADNIKSPFWLDEVIVPLAESISNRKGKKPYITGPCGLGSKVYIILHDPFDEDGCRLVDFTDVESLTVEPCFETTEGGSIALHFRYETGEVDTTYPEGSLGAYNGPNRVTEPLPDEPDEISKRCVVCSRSGRGRLPARTIPSTCTPTMTSATVWLLRCAVSTMTLTSTNTLDCSQRLL